MVNHTCVSNLHQGRITDLAKNGYNGYLHPKLLLDIPLLNIGK
jgi:hypothetical protein